MIKLRFAFYEEMMAKHQTSTLVLGHHGDDQIETVLMRLTRECEKLIAPMLSDILGETIVVHSEECATYPNGQCEVIFRSVD